MLKQDHSEIAKKLQELLRDSAQEVNALSGFSQRQRKLNAETFVQLVVLGWLEKPEASLSDVVRSGRRMGLKLSAQGLQARLDERAVLLLAGVFKAGLTRLQQAAGLEHAVLERFSSVELLDSTCVRLPLWLSGEFYDQQRGYSSVKLQMVFDLLHGQLEALEMSSAKVPDQTCDLPERTAQANSLWLFDLGYVAQDRLDQIARRGAYFVCRLQSQLALYTPSGTRFNLAACLKTCSNDRLERDVLVGTKVRLGARLVARRVSPHLAQQRRRAAHAKAKKDGYTCSDDYLALLGWECLLTNLTDVALPLLFALYALRWQIELLFKAAKSQLRLAQLGGFKPARLFCQLYAHLIALVIALALTADLRFHQRFELSFPKAIRLLQEAVPDLLRCIAHRWRGWSAALTRLRRDFLREAPKSTRKKSPSSLAHLLSIKP